MPQVISRLLPSQKGTHANPPTRRAKNTLSVVISTGKLQDRSFDPFRLTLISVVTTLLHTKSLHYFRVGHSRRRDRGSDFPAFRVGFFCKNRPIAFTATPKVPVKRRQQKVPRYDATVSFWQVVPVFEPEDCPLHHKIALVRSSESGHAKCGQHTLPRSSRSSAIGEERLPCSNG